MTEFETYVQTRVSVREGDREINRMRQWLTENVGVRDRDWATSLNKRTGKIIVGINDEDMATVLSLTWS